MEHAIKDPGSWLRGRGIWAAFHLGVIGWGGLDVLRLAAGTGPYLGRFSLEWLVGLVLVGILLLGLALLVLFHDHSIIPLASSQRLPGDRWLRYGLASFLILLPSWLFLGPLGKDFTALGLRTAIILWDGMLVGALLVRDRRHWVPLALIGILASASLYAVLDALQFVRPYPFKLYWSEGNRLWDYSLYFGADRYQVQGEFRLPNYMSPGRHGLWGLPFLIPNIGITWVRLWNVIVNHLPQLLLTVAILHPRRVQMPKVYRWLLGSWLYLFLLQTTVFAPILLCALVIYVGLEGGFARGLAATVLASAYAAVTRWTWFVAPGAWAGLVWLVRYEREDAGSVFRRLMRPVGLGLLGLVSGWLAHSLLAALQSGAEVLDPVSFNQPLLWYRLLPNPTYPPGILLAVSMAILPLLIFLVVASLGRWIRWDALQWLGVMGILVPFLVVGLIISVKIGGGSNLHNLDMFLLGLVLVVGAALEKSQRHLHWQDLGRRPLSQLALILALIFPLLSALSGGGPIRLPPEDQVNRALRELQHYVDEARGEVLFLDQRQLLTFGKIEGVKLVMDYELKELTNRAMIGSSDLFTDYYQDLGRKRFDLIITGHLPTSFRGQGHPFGEEDDAQVAFVYLPLLEHYEVVERFDDVGLWILAPDGAAP